MASETEISPLNGALTVLNDTEFADEDVVRALYEQYPEVATLENWANKSTRQGKGLFQRDQYVNPVTIFDKMRVAYQAVEQDDIVSGIADTTEQLAYKRITLETDDLDEAYVWQQMADELDLVNFMRQIWRDLFIASQAYPAVMFGRRDFKVRGRTTAGNRKKKLMTGVYTPIGLTLLDPLRVVPVGSFMFGQEQLAYIASPAEVDIFSTKLGEGSDPILNQLIVGKYNPSRAEARELNKLCGESVSNRLFLLDPDHCWRITATRPDYQRFASVRMESVFELLDIKHQLREMDRAALIGSTNAIILVKKGTDAMPAKDAEVKKLASQVRTGSRMPVIVGDHRIDIEIITPKTDKTLAPERYNGIDSRLTARLFQVLSTGSYSTGTAVDDSLKLLRVVAASMEARRDVIRDSMVAKVFMPTWERNDKLIDIPSMQFYPRRIALDFDPNIARFMQDLRDRGDISRETILAELDILEESESVKRQREAELYDHVFTPTVVPYSANQDNPDLDTRTAGRRRGGARNGGGRPAGMPNP